jgi:hypothetical protein
MESGGLSPLGAALALLATFLPIGQSLQIAGLNFFLFRLVLLAALVRALTRGEVRAVRWCRLDTLVGWWAVSFIALGTISHGVVASVYLMSCRTSASSR